MSRSSLATARTVTSTGRINPNIKELMYKKAGTEKNAYAVDPKPLVTRDASESLSADDTETLAAKALAEREESMRAKASSHEQLLDEKHSKAAVMQYAFMWRKKPSSAETAAKKAAAAKDGTFYVPHDVKSEPTAVRFDAETASKAFGVPLDRDVYLLSAYIESAHNSSPFPVNFTLHGVQGKSLERVWQNDGTASTLTLAPGQTWTAETPVFSMSKIDATNLYAFGNVDLEKEVSALTRKTGTKTYFVPANRFIGKIIAANLDEIRKTDTVDYVPKAEMYMVEENVIADIVSKFHEQVLQDLKTTNFAAIEGVLTRADRTPAQAKKLEFGDASDAPGIGTKAARDAAHSATHQVTVNVRYHIIDPTKLKKDEDE